MLQAVPIGIALRKHLWQSYVPHLDNLDDRTFTQLCRQFLHDTFTSLCIGLNTKLLSACRASLTQNPILWLLMARSECSRVLHWCFGYPLDSKPKTVCTIPVTVSPAPILSSVSICMGVFSHLYLSKILCFLLWISSLSKSFDFFMKYLLGLSVGPLSILSCMKCIIYFMIKSLLLLLLLLFLLLMLNWWTGCPRSSASILILFLISLDFYTFFLLPLERFLLLFIISDLTRASAVQLSYHMLIGHLY